MTDVFIDGSAGTTGLRIFERLSERDDVSLIILADELRRDAGARRRALNDCDIAFLCLPDDAARESVAMTCNPRTVIIDTSTAHRTDPRFAYGFPELGEDFRRKIAASRRIAVPGCHASGFVSLITPLVRAGLLPRDAALSCHSLTGYSGGGKKMIAEYNDCPPAGGAPREYGLSQEHKHLPEMTAVPGLTVTPVFCPIVSGYYSGMLVTVPLHVSQLTHGGIDDIREVYREVYREAYRGDIVKYVDVPQGDIPGFAAANALSGSDAMNIFVAGNGERILLCSVFDNLGKGSSGAALECLNIVTGHADSYGLVTNI